MSQIDEDVKAVRELLAWGIDLKSEANRAILTRILDQLEELEKFLGPNPSAFPTAKCWAESLEKELSDTRQLFYEVVEQRNQLLATQKILVEALERIERFNPSYEYTFAEARSIARDALEKIRE